MVGTSMGKGSMHASLSATSPRLRNNPDFTLSHTANPLFGTDSRTGTSHHRKFIAPNPPK